MFRGKILMQSAGLISYSPTLLINCSIKPVWRPTCQLLSTVHSIYPPRSTTVPMAIENITPPASTHRRT